MSARNRKRLIRIVISAVLYFPLLVLHICGMLSMPTEPLLFMAPYLVAGFPVISKAAGNIRRGRVFDENFLMLLATIGAFAVGEYSEGVAVMLFYQVGELFESIAVGKTREEVARMMDIAPRYANLETEDGVEQVDPEDVEVGSIICIRPGERIPLDGVVEEGSSLLDTSALTGESMPRSVSAGDEALSGCINGQGTLRIRTTRDYDNSTVARILELVENASSRKSRIEGFITRFAAVYTPAVTLCALALVLLGPVLFDPDLQTWVFRACTFLVVSCPCALVISVPLGFFCGIGAASRSGVLVKGSNYLEMLSRTRVMVFDKTGTLTEGRFKVASVHSSMGSEEELLSLAGGAELFSTHPLGQSLVEECRKRGIMPEASEVSDVSEVPGMGVRAGVKGMRVAAGSARLLEAEGVSLPEDAGERSDGSVIHVAVDGSYRGYVNIADSVREGAADALKDIKKAGINRIVMLTGDDVRAAGRVAESLGVDEHHASLLPADKVDRVEELLGRMERGQALAFVGDGINDTPVLARSDVGIAMGGIGSDCAIEAADVVLMHDDIGRIGDMIRNAKRTMNIVRQNIVFSLAVKLIVLLLGAVGLANMWAAVFADVGVSVLAISNSMRLLGQR